MLLGQYFLIMRSSMVDVLTEDFITVKRATGLPWDRVVRRHAVPNALLPLVTLSAIQFGAVVGGAITIETIFSWPGLGELSFQAINDKDFPVLAGHLPRLLRRGDPGQPARRLPLLLPRPAGAVDDERGAGRPRDLIAPEPRAPRATGASASCCSAPGAGGSGSRWSACSSSWRSSAGRSRRTTPTRRASTCSLRRASTTWLGHDRERLRRLLADPRRRAGLDRRRVRRGGDLGGAGLDRRAARAATSAAGPTAASTRSRTGSWSSRRCR